MEKKAKLANKKKPAIKDLKPNEAVKGGGAKPGIGSN
jgi:hypothetical protein